MAHPRQMPLVFQAKLFELRDDNEDVTWIQKAIGFPSFIRQDSLYKLKFEGYNDDTPFRYDINVHGNVIFERCQPKIMTWTLVKENITMALSFREEAGANSFWQLIDEYNKKEAVHIEVNSKEMFVLEYKIAEPTPSTLIDILSQLTAIPQRQKRQRICSIFLTKRDMLPKLKILFNDLQKEKSTRIPWLQLMFSLVQMILNFSDMELLMELLSDEYFMFTLGCLEYDPTFVNTAIRHRQFIGQKAQFLEVIPIKNRDKVRQIHLTYRLEYVKECALAHLLDQDALKLYAIVILSNYKDTLNYLIFNQKDKEYLNQLLNLLRAQEVKAYKLLTEITRIADKLELLFVTEQQSYRSKVYQALADKEIYEPLIDNIQKYQSVCSGQPFQPSPKSRIKTINELQEIAIISASFIDASLDNCPKFFKDHCYSERERVLKYPLVNFLLRCVGTKSILHEYFLRIFAMLTENIEAHSSTVVIQSIFIQGFLKPNMQYNPVTAVRILNRLSRTMSQVLTNNLGQILKKLLHLLRYGFNGMKCIKVVTLQIIRKLLNFYCNQPQTKQQILAIFMDNTQIITHELMLSKAHSSLLLSAILAVLLVLKKSDNVHLLQKIVEELRNKNVKHLYIDKLIRYVQHIAEWKDVVPVVIKRERISQIIGDDEFEGLPDKKRKT